ncbi:hypothetical protein FB451DRAFT_1391935 [Mycena latifolia]|nr:hypothetical protein FB451DRAFT_1391935 [Mycena latifolia]
MTRPVLPSSSDEDEAPPVPKPGRRLARGRDVTPVLDPTPLPPRPRKASSRQSDIDKENMATLQQQMLKMTKELSKYKRRAFAQTKEDQADPTLDDGPESEEHMSGEEDHGVAFSSAIRPLEKLPLPPQRPKPVLRKTTKPAEPKTAPRAFIRLPEPTPDERALDAQDTPPPSPTRTGIDTSSSSPRTSSPPPRSSSPATDSRGRAPPTDTASSRKRPRSPAASPPPAAKRPKPKQAAAFREGYVSIAGVKPKAADYAPIPHSLLLRACADYSARIVGLYAFPGVTQQMQWAKQSFRSAGRAAGERYAITDRMAKIIMARGSQIRGKMVDTYRSLFASHYGFEHSTAKKAIDANKLKASKLAVKASYHYKNPEEREGYGENKIIASVRKLTTFNNTDSVGILFPAYFNPISLFTLALDMTILGFCTEEWSTGTFKKATFSEKAVSENYCTHLADAERWSCLNEAVVGNIRRKWYSRASQTLISAKPLTTTTNIDDTQEDLLRNELAGRTGDTDSEAEADADEPPAEEQMEEDA